MGVGRSWLPAIGWWVFVAIIVALVPSSLAATRPVPPGGTTHSATMAQDQLAGTANPSRPRGLRVVAVSAHGFTLRWKVPRRHRGPIGYAVSLDAGSETKTSVRSSTFGGLSCGTAHALSVTTYDRHGRRSPSATVTARTAVCGEPCTGTAVPASADLSQTVASAPAGTTFCLSGRYQLTSPVVPRNGDAFIGNAGTVVDGAVPVGGWSASGADWVAAGPTTPTRFRISIPSMLYPQARYADDLLMDGSPLWKVGVQIGGTVIGRGPAAVGPGDYFVNYDTGQLVLGSDPDGHDLELTTVSRGFTGHATGVTIDGLVIQGFTFGGIVMPGRGGWRAANNEVRSNHAVGIDLGSGDSAVSNFIHANGDDGLAGAGSNVVVTANEVSGNDAARVDLANGNCWDGGGAKFVLTTNLVVTNNDFHDNLCHGLWLDINNDRSLIENNVSSGNRGDGILHEISYDATIARNTVAGNADFGIDISNSPGDTVIQNTVIDNARGGIIFFNQNRSADPAAFGRLVVRNLDVRGNRITNGSASQVTGGVDYTGSPAIFRSDGNRFQGNAYHLVARGAATFRWAGRRMTAAQWRAAGNDRRGTFTTP
jgi:hypothetical protein